MKGSRHRIGNYAAFLENVPRSPFREGDTVTVNGQPAVTVKKNYLTSEWTVRYADGRETVEPESSLTDHEQ
jgi:hypothetical protein